MPPESPPSEPLRLPREDTLRLLGSSTSLLRTFRMCFGTASPRPGLVLSNAALSWNGATMGSSWAYGSIAMVEGTMLDVNDETLGGR